MVSTLVENKSETGASLGLKSSRAIKSVASTQLISKCLTVAANFILARLLVPADFGVYGVVCVAVAMFGLVADGGLAAALLRQQEEPTELQENTIFWFQFALTLLQCLFIQLFATSICKVYALNTDALLLIRILSFGPIIATLRTIPSVRLERRLRFEVVTRIEVFQSLTYNASAIAAACLHLGPWSFAIASVLSQLVGINLLNLETPFKPRLEFDIACCKQKLRFGLKYQATNILGFLKDVSTPGFVGLMRGPATVGYVGFANQISSYGTLMTAPFTRLYLPIFSTAQNEPELLASVLTKVMRWNFIAAATFAALLIPNCAQIIDVVFGEKWLPATHLLTLLAFSASLNVMSYPLFSLCNSMNRADLPLSFATRSTVVGFILIVLLFPIFGISSIAVAQIISFSVFFPGFIKQTETLLPNFRLLPTIMPSLTAATTTVIAMLLLRLSMPALNAGLFNLIALGSCQFFLLLLLSNLVWKDLLRREILQFIRLVRPTKIEASLAEAM